MTPEQLRRLHEAMREGMRVRGSGSGGGGGSVEEEEQPVETPPEPSAAELAAANEALERAREHERELNDALDAALGDERHLYDDDALLMAFEEAEDESGIWDDLSARDQARLIVRKLKGVDQAGQAAQDALEHNRRQMR